MRVLIVEDEKRMAHLLKKALEEKSHSAVLAFSGKDGLAEAQNQDFDALVLDLMLPTMDGFEVAKQLRQANNRVPILVLTARDGVADIVKALDLGVDDYLTKPFALAEFMARLRAVARRGPANQLPRLIVRDLVMDTATCEVFRSEKSIALTRTEYALLEFMMRRPGRLLTRNALIEGVWGTQTTIEANTLEVFVKQLRAKIDNDHEFKLIQTVRGFGYRLREGSGG